MLFSVKQRHSQKIISRTIQAAAALLSGYFVGDMSYKEARQIHQKRMAVFDALYRGQHQLIASYGPLFSHIETLVGLIFSLNQLYYRVKDKTLFEIGAHELQSIQSVLVSLLNRLASRKLVVLYELDGVIQSFEKLVEQALRVIAPDPAIFLFFIQHLFALRNTIDRISIEWESL